MKEFYDGKKRPNLIGSWTLEELTNRICLNCGMRFGSHKGYECPGYPDNQKLKKVN